jgi:hypothetical protein
VNKSKSFESADFCFFNIARIKKLLGFLFADFLFSLSKCRLISG